MENKSVTQNTNFGFDNPEGQNLPPKPNNYLPLAIIGTVVGLCSPCCIGLILGIIAIVFSTQVDSKYGYKDYFGAEQSSRNTKILSLIAIVLGALNLIYTIIMFATGSGVAMLEAYQEILDQYAR